jgi:hypothetical protein
MTAGIEDKTIRPYIDPNDVLMALGGVTLMAGGCAQRDLARRLLDLLMDGLKYRSDSRQCRERSALLHKADRRASAAPRIRSGEQRSAVSLRR